MEPITFPTCQHLSEAYSKSPLHVPRLPRQRPASSCPLGMVPGMHPRSSNSGSKRGYPPSHTRQWACRGRVGGIERVSRTPGVSLPQDVKTFAEGKTKRSNLAASRNKRTRLGTRRPGFQAGRGRRAELRGPFPLPSTQLALGIRKSSGLKDLSAPKSRKLEGKSAAVIPRVSPAIHSTSSNSKSLLSLPENHSRKGTSSQHSFRTPPTPLPAPCRSR